jgi:hypothetical protein
MGDRGQVLILPDKVYLYTHWSAYNLTQTVQRALSKNLRWDDSEYLARIIFDAMIGKNQGEETGFGIGSKLHGDVYRLVTVNCENQTVKVEQVNYKPKLIFSGSFDKFIKHKFKEES